jgi:LysR family transcriptional activator of nhaA
MATINFKHLRYFWTIAKAGSIARASAQLHVTPQSISSQLAELEEGLGVALFRRAGRGLEITEIGARIVDYAESIFHLEDELLGMVRDQGASAPLPFRIGVADSVPKSLTYRVIEPALHIDQGVRLICREGRLVALLAELAVHRLDMVIADRPMPADVKVRAFSHLLGTSELAVFGADALVDALPGAFPAMLDGAPFLLPGESVVIRPMLERWFEAQGVRPRIVGEFDDSALLKAFGKGGAGLFVAPMAIADDIREQWGARAIGVVEGLSEQLYAITTERRMQHPAALAFSRAAAREVFGSGPASLAAVVPAAAAAPARAKGTPARKPHGGAREGTAARKAAR